MNCCNPNKKNELCQPLPHNKDVNRNSKSWTNYSLRIKIIVFIVVIFVFYFRFNDGCLEVVGLYSSLHIAKLQVNLAEPIKLGQAKTIKVTTYFELHFHLLFQNFLSKYRGVVCSVLIFFHSSASHAS